MDNLINQENIDKLFDQLINKGGRNTFFIITNSVKQTCVIPKKNMKMGLNLFQPCTNQGKLVKFLFPYFHYFKFVRTKLRIVKIKINIKDELKNLFQNIFHCENLDFAFFLGSPVVHQKITIQISHKGQFLGYCKLTNQQFINCIFEQEQRVLDELHRLNFNDVPQCLYCAPFNNDIFLFIQSTTKTIQSELPYKYENLIWNFLDLFHTKTLLNLPFVSSDYNRMLIELESLLQLYQIKESNLILATIGTVKSFFLENEVIFSAYHGDFTPWNCFIENNKLFAFDLEYFQRSYPPYLDYFHYCTQIAFYDKKWQAEQIYKYYLQHIDIIKKHIDNPVLYYQAYILHIIYFYLSRDEGKLNSIIENSYRIWIELLLLLNENELT